MIGRHVLDQYVIRSKIADGGMGSLYLAEQPAIGRNAVIKLVHPWLARDPKILQRFGTEARAAARLNNPHIVSIYNYGRMNDGTLFIAMEHISGCTLGELIRAEGRLDPARAVSIATQVCEALAEAHRKGVIHRDLKPSNIMLVSRGGGPVFVKVLDFGIAVFENQDTPTPTKVVGTPRYMSPEQAAGQPADARSDLYMLALIVYEMIAGRSPFLADSPAEYLSKHINEQPPPLAQACPGVRVNPALEACLMRALAKAPHQRPQSADAFADELWSALMATVEIGDMPIPQPRPRRRKSVVPAVIGITVLMMLMGAAGAGAYLWYQRGSESTVVTEAPAPPGPAPKKPTAESPRLPSWLSGAPPSSEKQALMDMTIPELDAELERVTLLSGLSRESIAMSLTEYRAAISDPPPGVDPEDYHKALLVELIIRWRATRVENPPADRSLTELEAVFLTMHSGFDVQTRRRMLARLKDTMVNEPDPELAVKRTLMKWIAEYGGPSATEAEGGETPDDLLIVDVEEPTEVEE
jgi:serine/threonine-protein kinase